MGDPRSSNGCAVVDVVVKSVDKPHYAVAKHDPVASRAIFCLLARTPLVCLLSDDQHRITSMGILVYALTKC